jgi:hypothetical protein
MAHNRADAQHRHSDGFSKLALKPHRMFFDCL